MLTQRDDVVKQMTFDIDEPINTVFNYVEELGNINTADLNPYNDHQYINLDYNIINKAGQYRIRIREWNQKDKYEKLGCIKPKFLNCPSGIEGCC